MAEPTKVTGASSPATTIPAHPDIAVLMAKVAVLTDQLANLQRTMAVERPMAMPLKIAQDREEAFEKIKAELSKSCLQRTQELAENMWGKDTRDRYVVQVADQLELRIPARSPEEAKGRYDKISGIISVDMDKHKYKIELVNNAA